MNEHIRRHRLFYLAVVTVAVVVFAILPLWSWLAE